MVILSRRQIVKACKHRGWTIQAAALEGIEALLESSNDPSNDLQELLHIVQTHMKGQRVLSKDIWEEIVEKKENEDPTLTLSTEKYNEMTHHFQDLQVMSAFQMPKLTYQTVRKQFSIAQEPWSVFGSAEDKINMLAQRYALVHQRILRHELFRPNDLHGGGGHYKLTPIESLLGKRSKDADLLLLLGILIQIEEGQYYLEDPTGQVPVSFQDATAVDGFFVMEHCILLVEGVFQDGVLFVHRLGHPLLEAREASLRGIQQQVTHPFYSEKRRKRRQQQQHVDLEMHEESFVILSDLHMDHPRVVQQLEGLFATYANYSPNRLPLFVLMGNFCSTPQLHSGSEQLMNALEELLGLISKVPTLKNHAHFCIVPGPHDGVIPVLPYAPLTMPPRNKVEHVHLASNPCRITWKEQEMVVFRGDLLHLMQQEQIRLQSPQKDLNDDDSHHRLPHCRLVKTILDQGHLVPCAGVPIYWNYDHALRLYPLPSSLVLGGDASEPFHEIYAGCDVIHPGSVFRHASYATYKPSPPSDDNDDDGNDEMQTSNTVEFFVLGTQSMQ